VTLANDTLGIPQNIATSIQAKTLLVLELVMANLMDCLGATSAFLLLAVRMAY
jgi:hypothetical protein